MYISAEFILIKMKKDFKISEFAIVSFRMNQMNQIKLVNLWHVVQSIKF